MGGTHGSLLLFFDFAICWLLLASLCLGCLLCGPAFLYTALLCLCACFCFLRLLSGFPVGLGYLLFVARCCAGSALIFLSLACFG